MDSPPTVVAVPTPPVDANPLPSPVDDAFITSITAEELYRVYSRNLIFRANPEQRFRNHRLLVIGTFQGTTQSPVGHTYLELATSDPDAFTYAELSPQAASLLPTLKPGSKLRLLCRGSGMVAGSPLLRRCISQ